MKTISFLIDLLLEEMPRYRAWADEVPPELPARRRLLRGLMNLRPPAPLREEFCRAQDALLLEERAQKGVVEAAALPVTAADSRLALWRGDITRLSADAIVNAANSALLGCFSPCHGCIDNAVHSAAGLQLRDECYKIMRGQGHEEPAGQAKLTKAYCLPSRYVLHTVGPIVSGSTPSVRDREELASCYRSCLALAAKHGLESVAFCCVSTGEYHFPGREAAPIAVKTVEEFLEAPSSVKKVIFNVFKEPDENFYRALLGPDQTARGGAAPR